VTCWTRRPEDEHRLLSAVLGGDLKPSLDVVVIAPYPEEFAGPIAPPVTEGAAVVGRRRDIPDKVDPMRMRRIRR
jgi:hypothetical protein